MEDALVLVFIYLIILACAVLILVLMEDALVPDKSSNLAGMLAKVLILVLMEDALVQKIIEQLVQQGAKS